MSKELEALEVAKQLKEFVLGFVKNGLDRRLIIGSFYVIEEELKALEIIEKKNVFVWGFIHRKEEIKDFEHTYDYYKTHYGYFHSGYEFELLTQEEFDLLKEVLL